MIAATLPRLDVWLAEARGITRHASRTLIDAGLVTVNGRPGRPGQRVRLSDAVVVASEPIGTDGQGSLRGVTEASRNDSERRASRVSSGGAPARAPTAYPEGSLPIGAHRETLDATTTAPLRIVYEDEWLAVVDKPAGMVVHPAPGHPAGTLADALRERGTTWSLLGGEERPGIVHRLDRDTSGLLVVAKTEAAHRALAAQLRDRTLGRTYWAAVHGGFREATGTIDAPIARDPRNRKRMAVVDGGRAATTDFRVDERLGDVSVLSASLRTGRTHQIRVHLAYVRHPVVGDTVYGRNTVEGPNRLALHAAELRFAHPAGGDARTFTSPLPDALDAWISGLRTERR